MHTVFLPNRDDPSSSRKKHKKFQKKRRVKDMERSSGDSVTEDDECTKLDAVPVLPNNQEQHQSGMEADYESQDAGDRKKSPSGGAEGPLSSNAPEVKELETIMF